MAGPGESAPPSSAICNSYSEGNFVAQGMCKKNSTENHRVALVSYNISATYGHLQQISGLYRLQIAQRASKARVAGGVPRAVEITRIFQGVETYRGTLEVRGGRSAASDGERAGTSSNAKTWTGGRKNAEVVSLFVP